MNRKLDDLKKKLPAPPSPIPSPTLDAPSPGNTPPLEEMDNRDAVDMDLDDDGEPTKIACEYVTCMYMWWSR